MQKRYLLILLFLVLQMTITVGIGIATAYAFDHEQAPYGVRVGQLNLEGYSKDEAWEQIEAIMPQEVVYNGQVYKLSIVDSRENAKSWLEKQYRFEGSVWLEKVAEYVKKHTGEKILPDVLLGEEIIPQLEMIKKEIDRPAFPAQFIDEGEQSVIKPEETGYGLDVEGSWQKLRASYTNRPVSLVVEPLNVRPTKQELASVNEILGDFTTFFNPGDLNRANNLRLAANALNNTLVAPGEEFSFNRVVGERTEVAGYKKAYIYVNKTVLLGDGGGICQDSSTLYQAVLRANLPILERHTHTLAVNYVPTGEDATVAYGLLDFRFKNDTRGYLLIKARTGDNWLRTQLIGLADSNHPVQEFPEGYPASLAKWEK